MEGFFGFIESYLRGFFPQKAKTRGSRGGGGVYIYIYIYIYTLVYYICKIIFYIEYMYILSFVYCLYFI